MACSFAYLMSIEVKHAFLRSILSLSAMLFTGRFMIGVGLGGQQVFFRLYFGETSLRVTQLLPADKQKKSTLKYTLFFMAFTIGTTFFAIGPGN